MQRRRVPRGVRGVALLAAGLFAGACAGGGSDPAQAVDPGQASSGGSDGARYEVGVDGWSDDAPVSFHRFYPDRLAVNPGDTVVFRRTDNGEPHTVTFAAEPPREDAIPGQRFFDGGFAHPPRTDTSMPCFLREGRPPTEGCTAAEQQPVAFDGTHTWFNSGGMLGDEEFPVELSEDLAPGSYLFVCLIHRTMQVTVDVVDEDAVADDPGTVLDEDAPADDPGTVLARGREQLARDLQRAQQLIDERGAVIDGVVEAATSGPPFVAWVNTFVPEDATIPVGGTVTWLIRGVHTVSFNAPESARPFYQRAADGSVEENPEGAVRQGDQEAWDGSGMLNSGILEGLFPPARFSVTFTTPGTYPYRCLVHFDMEGRVTVRG